MKRVKSEKKSPKLSRRAPSKKQKPLIKSKAKSSNKKKSAALKNKKPSNKNKKMMKKSGTKQISGTRKGGKSAAMKTTTTAKTVAKPIRKNKIVRIMGQGQFTVDNDTLKKLNQIDDSIVELVSNHRSDPAEFRKRLEELTDIVEKKGKPLDPKEIIQSDIILPTPDLSIDEAKKLFEGEGVIPETEV
jgi:hypothetical protein